MSASSPARTEGSEAQSHPIRVVTAASLFDGHDAAINVMRRILQASGAEVIHLGHNRSVAEVVTTAVQEDAHAIALSSYQGGHMEYFAYAVEELRRLGAGHIQVFGGGGGVIVPSEIEALHEAGVARIYSPEDGRKLGLQGMIDDILQRLQRPIVDWGAPDLDELRAGNEAHIARGISVVEAGGGARPAPSPGGPWACPPGARLGPHGHRRRWQKQPDRRVGAPLPP